MNSDSEFPRVTWEQDDLLESATHREARSWFSPCTLFALVCGPGSLVAAMLLFEGLGLEADPPGHGLWLGPLLLLTHMFAALWTVAAVCFQRTYRLGPFFYLLCAYWFLVVGLFVWSGLR